ncbi:MAG: response regulator transcription factor [Burkholderiaceae bacterium]
MRIAVVDSNTQQRARIIEILRYAQHHCIPFSTPEKLVLDRTSEFDLLVYHWQPTAKGHGALLTLRRTQADVPMLLLTGHSADHSLAEFLNNLHTDYLVQPIRAADLRLRVKLLMMRLAPERTHSALLESGRYSFDPAHLVACQDGKPMTLTRKEFSLALLLFSHLGQPLSRATLHESVWPKTAEFNSRSLDTHIARVRRKFALQPEHGYRLSPVYGYGYVLEAIDFPGQNPLTQQV